MPTIDNPNLLDDESLNKIRDLVLQKAKQLAPNHLSDAIDAILVKGKKANNYSIKFEVGLSTHKDARAWEYGSGERATRNFKSPKQLGAKKRYVIEGNPYLAFFWEVNKSKGEAVDVNALYAGKRNNKTKFVSQGKDNGKLIFTHVEHPGIYPANSGRGYLRPALADSTDEIVDIVGKTAVENLKIKTRQIFSKVTKK